MKSPSVKVCHTYVVPDSCSEGISGTNEGRRELEGKKTGQCRGMTTSSILGTRPNVGKPLSKNFSQ